MHSWKRNCTNKKSREAYQREKILQEHQNEIALTKNSRKGLRNELSLDAHFMSTKSLNFIFFSVETTQLPNIFQEFSWGGFALGKIV